MSLFHWSSFYFFHVVNWNAFSLVEIYSNGERNKETRNFSFFLNRNLIKIFLRDTSFNVAIKIKQRYITSGTTLGDKNRIYNTMKLELNQGDTPYSRLYGGLHSKHTWLIHPHILSRGAVKGIEKRYSVYTRYHNILSKVYERIIFVPPPLTGITRRLTNLRPL